MQQLRRYTTTDSQEKFDTNILYFSLSKKIIHGKIVSNEQARCQVAM